MLNTRSIAETIIRLRTEQGLTQDQLAERVYVTRQAVSKWESGKALPSVDAIVSLSLLFHVSIEELLCLK